jgi:hypothetical protein
VTAAKEQATSTITASVDATRAQITGDTHAHVAQVGAWSAGAIPAGERAVAEHAEGAAAASEVHASQASGAGHQAGQSAADTLRGSADQTEQGTGSGPTGDAAPVYAEVD